MKANYIWHQYIMTLGKIQKEVMSNKHQEMYALATLWFKKVLFIFLALTCMKRPYHI
jgi:hypothetical protein